MKANKAIVYTFTALAIGISFIYSSCKKGSSDCGSMMYAAINTVIVLEIKNSQNKDLLDPATPGHYDTAYIKRSNPWLGLARQGTLPIIIGFNYMQAEQHILILSATDQDTINVSTQTVAEKCYTYTKLTEFKYNNSVLKPDSSAQGAYVIHK